MSTAKMFYRCTVIILLGIGIFFLDYYQLSSDLLNAFILFFTSTSKSLYFIYLVLVRIKESVRKDFFFHEFISFVGMSVVLIIISFAIDFYCLYRIDAGSFFGIQSSSSMLTQIIAFIYFSISTFTTAGYGDIYPLTAVGQVFVSMELIIAFFFIILVITNVFELRESFTRQNFKE